MSFFHYFVLYIIVVRIFAKAAWDSPPFLL